MRRLLLTATVVLGLAVPAWADIPIPGNCGSTTIDLTVAPDYAHAAVGAAKSRAFTRIEITPCGIYAKVMMYQEGAGLVEQWGGNTAEVWQVRYYNPGDRVVAHSRHQVITYLPVDNPQVIHIGLLDRETTMPSQQAAYYTPEECGSAGYEWNWNGHGCETPGSPIVIDLAHNGIRLTSVAHGVLFDLDGDGVQEQLSWTRRDSDDSWLAFDRNGNGMIDNGTELFGNFTPSRLPGVNADNGFEALKVFDLDYSEAIDNRREGGAILVWTDRNHNGLSEPDELQSAEAAGLRSMSTTYKLTRRTDRHGNQFRQKGTATFVGGRTDTVWDVWLVGETADDDETP